MIYIGNKTRILKADKLNLAIETLNEVKVKKDNKLTGETKLEWKHYGYCGTLEQAMSLILKNRLFDLAEDELLLKDIIVTIQNIGNELKNEIKGIK